MDQWLNQQLSYMAQTDNNTGDQIAAIFNLCERDPNTALETLNAKSRDDPDYLENPLTQYGYFLAYASLGVFKKARENDWFDPAVTTDTELRSDLGITEQDLDRLETALSHIKRMEEIRPNSLDDMTVDDMPEQKMDAAAIVLDRCRPGKVQEILQQTKLRYFGHERIRIHDDWRHVEVAPYLDTFFSSNVIIKSALIVSQTDYHGKDALHVALYEHLHIFNEDDTQNPFADVIYLCKDGSYYQDLKVSSLEVEVYESSEPSSATEQDTLATQQSIEPSSPASSLLPDLSKPWWKVASTLRFWFLVYLLAVPLLILYSVLTGTFGEIASLLVSWLISFSVFAYWDQWSRNVETISDRFSLGFLAASSWILAGVSIPLLAFGFVTWWVMLFGVALGASAFFVAQTFHSHAMPEESILDLIAYARQLLDIGKHEDSSQFSSIVVRMTKNIRDKAVDVSKELLFGPDIEGMKERRDINSLKHLLAHKNVNKRIQAADALSDLGYSNGLSTLLEDPDPKARVHATEQIKTLESRDLKESLIEPLVKPLKYGTEAEQLEALARIQGRYHTLYLTTMQAYGVPEKAREELETLDSDSTLDLELIREDLYATATNTNNKATIAWYAAITLVELGERDPKLAHLIIQITDQIMEWSVQEDVGRSLFGGVHELAVREDTIRALSCFSGNPDVTDVLLEALQGDRFVGCQNINAPCRHSIIALGALGDPCTYERLEYIAQSTHESRANNAQAAVDHFGKATFDEIHAQAEKYS